MPSRTLQIWSAAIWSFAALALIATPCAADPKAKKRERDKAQLEELEKVLFSQPKTAEEEQVFREGWAQFLELAVSVDMSPEVVPPGQPPALEQRLLGIALRNHSPWPLRVVKDESLYGFQIIPASRKSKKSQIDLTPWVADAGSSITLAIDPRVRFQTLPYTNTNPNERLTFATSLGPLICIEAMPTKRNLKAIKFWLHYVYGTGKHSLTFYRYYVSSKDTPDLDQN